jgi:L-2-hydroxycarboxylate dehydrogenase (NAD+)
MPLCAARSLCTRGWRFKNRCGETRAFVGVGTDVLVVSDLRGNDSHGVSNMLRMYMENFIKVKAGLSAPRYGSNSQPNFEVVRDSPATAVVDADGALGIHVGTFAMRMAVEKAKALGVGTVVVRNAGHFGAIGYFSDLAAREGCLGQVMLGGLGGAMVPVHGQEKKFSTNPVAWSAPANTETPFRLDVATTQVAANKVELARRMGAKLYPNIIAKDDGTPISEEVLPPAGRQTEGVNMLPFGGTREGGAHKGFGLAMIGDLWANALGVNEQDTADAAGRVSSGGAGIFCAWNIEAFTDREDYDRAADGLLHDIRTSKPAAGHDRVLYPGLGGAEVTAKRKADGIPYHPEVIVWFHRAAAELGAEVQAAVAQFPEYAHKCTPEDEAAWRREPVFVTSAEEKAMSPKL